VSSAPSVPGDIRPGAEDSAAASFVTTAAVPAGAASAGLPPGGATPAPGRAAGPALSGPVPSGPVLSGLALARGEVDRSAHLRTDADWLQAAWGSTGLERNDRGVH
jgi:hypothetical protein